MTGSKKWYFTFGKGQVLEGKVQPIQAQTSVQARAEMIRQYRLNWSMQYSESQWNNFKAEAELKGWQVEEELPLIVLDGLGEVQNCT